MVHRRGDEQGPAGRQLRLPARARRDHRARARRAARAGRGRRRASPRRCWSSIERRRSAGARIGAAAVREAARYDIGDRRRPLGRRCSATCWRGRRTDRAPPGLGCRRAACRDASLDRSLRTRPAAAAPRPRPSAASPPSGRRCSSPPRRPTTGAAAALLLGGDDAARPAARAARRARRRATCACSRARVERRRSTRGAPAGGVASCACCLAPTPPRTCARDRARSPATRRRARSWSLYGDIVTHREALAGVLADPRLGDRHPQHRRAHRAAVRASARARARGRVVERRRRRTTTCAAPERHVPRRAQGRPPATARRSPPAAERLAALLADPRRRLARTSSTQGAALAPLARAQRSARRGATPCRRRGPPDRRGSAEPTPASRRGARSCDAVELPADVTRPSCAPARCGAPRTCVSLLLVGLVRGGVAGRPQLPARAVLGAPAVARRDGRGRRAHRRATTRTRSLLDSAVKASDGFFTTFFVSPYSQYIARWAARRGLTPNQVTTVSLRARRARGGRRSRRASARG